MKANKTKISLPKGFSISNALDEKYANQPLFLDKIEKANQILKTIGLPKM